jgi:hypothetical protein
VHILSRGPSYIVLSQVFNYCCSYQCTSSHKEDPLTQYSYRCSIFGCSYAVHIHSRGGPTIIVFLYVFNFWLYLCRGHPGLWLVAFAVEKCCRGLDVRIAGCCSSNTGVPSLSACMHPRTHCLIGGFSVCTYNENATLTVPRFLRGNY